MSKPLTHGAADDRRRRLMALVQSDGFASVTQLSEVLGVSQMTVRRDLHRLAIDGGVRLVHGGATATAGLARPSGEVGAGGSVRPAEGHDAAEHAEGRVAEEHAEGRVAAEQAEGRVAAEPAVPPFSARQRVSARSKQRIGAAAAALVKRRTTVGVDAGTTALEVVRHLSVRFDGVVVTHSVPVLAELLERPGIRVIGIGGELLPETRAMVGGRAVEQLRGLRLRLLVLGAGAVDAEGVYVRSQVELEAKRVLLEIADEVMLVADAGKLTASAPVRVCGLERVDTWVIDRPLPAALAEVTRRNGSRVVVAAS